MILSPCGSIGRCHVTLLSMRKDGAEATTLVRAVCSFVMLRQKCAIVLEEKPQQQQTEMMLWSVSLSVLLRENDIYGLFTLSPPKDYTYCTYCKM